MTDTSGQQNAEKSALETEKLVLDKRLLERQLSVQGRLIAWLQAASVPVALLGAILAFFVGFGQLRQVAENQAADRFDKALTRLASARPDERMTGISGLQLFLRDRNSLLQNQALQFLINGLSLETAREYAARSWTCSPISGRGVSLRPRSIRGCAPRSSGIEA